MLAASSVAAWLALIWAAVLLWLAIGAALRRHQLHARHVSSPRVDAAGRRVLLIRPCAGDEPGLQDNLLSIAKLSTTATLRVVLTVDSSDDSARPILEQVADQLRARGLDVRAELHPPSGPNRKASMLAAVLREHGPAHELVVNVDSNVELEGFDLDALLGPVLAPGVTAWGMEGARRAPTTHAAEPQKPAPQKQIGVAWAPWAERREFPGVGPRASEAVLGGSLTAFPLLCGIHPNGLVGKIWAARIDALAASGDFGELARYLGEDLAMADRLRAAGFRIAVVPLLGRARGGHPSFDQAVERFGRWMLVVRSQQPRLMASYPLFFFASPLVSTLALLGAPGQPTLALTALLFTVVARLLVTFTARFWSGRSVQPLATVIDAVLSDVVLLLAWVRAVSRREIEWRGRRLRVEPSGQLSSVESRRG